jgi:hypothetical protein
MNDYSVEKLSHGTAPVRSFGSLATAITEAKLSALDGAEYGVRSPLGNLVFRIKWPYPGSSGDAAEDRRIYRARRDELEKARDCEDFAEWVKPVICALRGQAPLLSRLSDNLRVRILLDGEGGGLKSIEVVNWRKITPGQVVAAAENHAALLEQALEVAEHAKGKCILLQ